MSRIYKVYIEDSVFEIEWWQVKRLFKEKYHPIIRKVSRQGGKVKLSIKAIKEELL